MVRTRRTAVHEALLNRMAFYKSREDLYVGFPNVKDAVDFLRCGIRVCVDLFNTDPAVEIKPGKHYIRVSSKNRKHAFNIRVDDLLHLIPYHQHVHFWHRRIVNKLRRRRVQLRLQYIVKAMASRASVLHRARKHRLFERRIFIDVLAKYINERKM